MQRVGSIFKAIVKKTKGKKKIDGGEVDLALDTTDLPKGPQWPLGNFFGCDLCSLVIRSSEAEAEAQNEGEEQKTYTFGRFHCQECQDFDVCHPCFSEVTVDEHIATFHSEAPFSLTVPREYLFVEETVSNPKHVERIVRDDTVVPSIARYQHTVTLEYSGRVAVGYRSSKNPETSEWITFEDIGREAELASFALRHLLQLEVEFGDEVPKEPFSMRNQCHEATLYGGMSDRCLIADLTLLLVGPALISAHIHPSADGGALRSLFDLMSARCLFVSDGAAVPPVDVISAYAELAKAEEAERKPLVVWMGKECIPDDVKTVSDQVSVQLFDWEGLQDLGRRIVRERKYGTRSAFEVPLYHPSDVITIVFSSGTTGVPKGIPIRDQCWRGHLESAPPAAHTSCSIAYQPFSLSGPRQNYYHRNIVGARSFLCPNPARLYDDLLLCRPTIFSGPPRVFQDLYQIYLQVKSELIAESPEDDKLTEPAAAAIANARIREMLGGRVQSVSRGGAPTSTTVRDWLYECFSDYHVNESYGLTECSGITINNWITPEVHVKLTDWGEYKTTDKPYPRGLVWVKADHQITNYYKKAPDTDTFSEDGYFCTGDIGEMIEPGVQLRLLGRQKELVKLSMGEFVRPVFLENLLLDEINSHEPYLGVTQIFVHADSLFSFLVALCVCPADENISYEKLQEKERSLEVLMGRIGVERHLRRWETPVRVCVVKEVFSKENGLLTDSLKPSRRKIVAKYERELVAMLDDASHSVTEDVLAALTSYEEGKDLAASQLPPMFNVDSIAAVQLANRIRTNYGVNIPATAIAVCTSASCLVELFGLIRSGELFQEDATEWVRSNEGSQALTEDLVLPHTLTEFFEGSDAVITPELSAMDTFAVLLTGATGFVGAHLLKEIVTQYPSATVHCIVRRTASQSAEERLRSSLEKRQCWNDEYSDRILAIEGDLSFPRLGISDEKWKELTGSVVWIVHAGALVNAMMPYSKHRPVNVLSTRQLLAFCIEGSPKHLDFISSMSVYCHGEEGTELTEISQEALPLSGYGRSKAVGDMLVKAAIDKGLSATIHRLGYIGPSSETGAANEKDWLTVLLKGVRDLSIMPPSSAEMQVLCVDKFCKAFLLLSTKRAVDDIVAYHYTSEGSVAIEDVLYRWAEKISAAGGKEVELVSIAMWQRLLAASPLEQAKSLFSHGIPDRTGRTVARTSAVLQSISGKSYLFNTPSPEQCLVPL